MSDARRATINIHPTVGTDVPARGERRRGPRLRRGRRDPGSPGCASGSPPSPSVGWSGWANPPGPGPASAKGTVVEGDGALLRWTVQRRAPGRGVGWAMTITVVLAEDQRMVLGALEHPPGAGGRHPPWWGTAADGERRVRLVRGSEARRPADGHRDAQAMTGLEVAAEVLRRGLPTRVVILTTFARRRVPPARTGRRCRRLPAQGRAPPAPALSRSATCTPGAAPSTPSSPPTPGASRTR